MKIESLCAVVILTLLHLRATAAPRETFCPHFPTNAPIVWRAPTSQLPKGFWIYRRLPARPFSVTVISNAVVLAGLERKGMPPPDTKAFIVSEDSPENFPGPIPVVFEIAPKSATINYSLPHPEAIASHIPADTVLVARARNYARQLGIDAAQIRLQRMADHFNLDERGYSMHRQVAGRSVYLARVLEGVTFWDPGDEGGNDGFWIEFGSGGKIRSFCFNWPELQRYEFQPAASPGQIIACIRAFKTMILPANDGDQYFDRVKSFSHARKLTINKMTAYYGEGIFGEAPTNDAPPEYVIPMAQLEAIADFGSSNVAVQLYSPIIVSEVVRLLARPEPAYQGRKASAWLRDFDEPSPPGTSALAADAMRHMGSPVVPFLVEQLTAGKEKAYEAALAKWQAGRTEDDFSGRPSNPRGEALAGIDALGAAAEAALPALASLLREDPPQPITLYVVARIGPGGRSLLCQCLTNDAKVIRLGAKVCLQMQDMHSEVLYPRIPVGPDAPSFGRRICEFNLKLMGAAFQEYQAGHPGEIGGDLNSEPPPRWPQRSGTNP